AASAGSVQGVLFEVPMEVQDYVV
ncbi:MAG: hypothetical protein QG656_2566, partial [Candidatus Hydrogenedentes bacterium]|nr:hypothetical protein [Candidatus Hydrogenedentota bacterium]